MGNGGTHGDHNHSLVVLWHWVLAANTVIITLRLCFAREAMHVLIAA